MQQIRGEEGKVVGITQEHGVKYIPSWTPYSDMDVTADKIRRLKDNVYCRGLVTKQKSLIFTDIPTIEALDANEDPAEELQKILTKMFFAPEVNLPIAIDQTFVDRLLYGASVFNWVWQKEGAEVVLKKLNHLPSFTFSLLPSGVGKNYRLYSKILQGILLNDETQEMEFYQMNKDMMTTTQLDAKNLYFIKDESDEELAGTPLILPLIPFFEMSNYTWNAEMQVVNRVGAPMFFIKIKEPQPANASNGFISDIDYANLILANWGKDTAYPLRENMTIEVPSVHEGTVNIEAIEALHYVMIDYFSPASFVSRQGQTLIGGSALSEGQLVENYTRGIQRSLENSWSKVVTRYCDINGYTDEGYTARVVIPFKGADRLAIQIQQALVGWNTKQLFPAEIRDRLGAEGLSEEEMVKLAEYYKANAPPAPTFGGAPTLAQMLNALNSLNATPSAKKVEDSTQEDLDRVIAKFGDGLLGLLEQEV